MASIGVAVGTFGEDTWKMTAQRALWSTKSQKVPPVNVVHVHGETLADARNEASDKLGTEWQIFLDADDMLQFKYIYEMEWAIKKFGGKGIFRPATQGMYEDGTFDEQPMMIERGNLRVRNYAVIGSMHRKEDFDAVGQFSSKLDSLEDWELWIRMTTQLQIPIHDVHDAVYFVGVSDSGRNSGEGSHGRMYSRIKQQYRKAKFPEGVGH